MNASGNGAGQVPVRQDHRRKSEGRSVAILKSRQAELLRSIEGELTVSHLILLARQLPFIQTKVLHALVHHYSGPNGNTSISVRSLADIINEFKIETSNL